jgi:hypothetical protein
MRKLRKERVRIHGNRAANATKGKNEVAVRCVADETNLAA